VELGFRNALVQTGNTQRDDRPRYPNRPTLVVETVAELDAASRASGYLPDREAAAPVVQGVTPTSRVHGPATALPQRLRVRPG
jgi:hypothetical protein